jgi:hypothetical protein
MRITMSATRWNTVEIKLRVVGAGRARDDGATTLHSLCKYRGHGPLLQSIDVLNLLAVTRRMGTRISRHFLSRQKNPEIKRINDAHAGISIMFIIYPFILLNESASNV